MSVSNPQAIAKRAKLSGAFSMVPPSRVEVPRIASTALAASKSAVYAMPPPITKYDSGIPV